MNWNTHIETWKLKEPFTTARHYFEEIRTLTITIDDGTAAGSGEAAGVDNLGEDVDKLAAQLDALLSNATMPNRLDVQDSLPAGGARNALDCALWDLECKRSGKSIWQLLDLAPKKIQTVYTLPIQSAEAMAANAKRAALYPLLKVKLDADRPIEKMTAIRQARPDARIIVDCNQGWDMNLLRDACPIFADLKVEMIEQPLKVGLDDELEAYQSPLPLCADESCNTTADLDHLDGKYEMINIKLDKTGGLTEALKLADQAERMGFELMVGNMLGTSLGMAPAFVIAQFCKYADLDGPLLQIHDRDMPLQYSDSWINVPDPRLWG